MAQDPAGNARRYALSSGVAADLEDDEGPPSGAQHGQSRTVIPEHSGHRDHGPKTRARAKAMINRQV
jgi:hypothetical protein